MTVVEFPGGLTRADLDAVRACDGGRGRRYELVEGSILIDAAPGGRLSPTDLDAMPDDGRRYELLEGTIIVTQSPRVAHQQAVGGLLHLLRSALTPGLQVLMAPLDVPVLADSVLQPDVLVLPSTAIADDRVRGVPALAVEVLSPSTRRRDLGDKLRAYRDTGVPAYWVVDPHEPRLRAWHLDDDGAYVEVADVGPDEAWTTDRPFPVTVRPADLLR